MRRSTDGILTTHVGALQRPLALSKAMAEQGEWAPAVLPELRDQVAAVVRRQVNAGIDIVDDGEFGKTMWSRYIIDRLGTENIIAGADCGFGSRIHPELGWAKLAALVEGAALASSRL
jgi:methionine synthase II (cobalamin-independent)